MQAVADQGFQISECVTCCEPIATLVLCGDQAATGEWECCHCGATYVASLAASSPSQLRHTIKPLHYFPDHRKAETTLRATDIEKEMRHHPRKPLMVSVPVVQLDDDLFPIGEEFTVVSRNLSASGIAILCTRPLSGKFAVLIELPELGHVQLLLDIVRCKDIGMFYEMGGAFFDRK